MLLGDPDELSPDSTTNLERYAGEPLRAEPDLLGDLLAGSGAIVDAIFGTGFSGVPRDPAAAAIEAINGAGCPVVACDIASGVDAATGVASGGAVGATRTVTFHAAKLGHLIEPGRSHTGELTVADIGIPAGAPVRPAGGTIGIEILDQLPRRGDRSNKFSSGNVLVVGGSRGLTGAVCMAAGAAVRAGAGYAAVATPAELEPILETKLTEVMTLGVAGSDGSLEPGAAPAILERSESADCVVLGPGLGRAPRAAELARELAASIRVPLLVDADGLNALGTDLEQAATGRPLVLTPHAGELGRLLGVESEAVSAARLDSAREAARRCGGIVVLKGSDTIVTDGERLAINALASPGLATAGTGDVLSGAIAALIARGLEPFEACAAGGSCPRPRGPIRRRANRGGRVGDSHGRDRGPARGPGALMDAFQRVTAWVDTAAVERNCRRLGSELSPGTLLCAVVKSNGYGHGMIESARAALAGGARVLAVATAGEAFELRAAIEESPILVMGALTDPELDVALGARAEIGVWRPGFLEAVAERGASLGLRPRVHVKFDTGMGRLGERDPAAGRAAARARRRRRPDRAGGALDPFRDRRRARLELLRRAARALPRACRPGPRATRPAAARGEQRRDPAVGRLALRHGPLRRRRLRARSVRRGSGRVRARAGDGDQQLRG